MRKIIVVSLFLIFIWFISDHNSVFAVQINCRGQIGDRGSGQQAADDSGCATALSCPEELRIAGKCGNLNEVENSSILSKFCSTFDFVENSSLCRWAGGGEDLSIPSELINQRESKSQEVAQSSGTRVISQANTFSITDKIVGWFISDRDTGALNKYLPYQVQQNTDDSSSPLTTHNLVAGCGEGKGSAAVPYELCNKIAYNPGEDNNGDGGVPDENYPSPIITPSTETYQIEGCPPSSERIFIDESRYLHLEHQFRCSTPRMIVVHWSGGWSTAQDTYNDLNLLKDRRDTDRNGNSIKSRRSCQFAIDENETIQMLDLYSNPNAVQMGWCAGGDNNIGSFNLEISGAWFDITLDNPGSLQFKKLEAETNEAIRVTCDLIKRYNIPKTEVYGHYQLQYGKSDPGINYLK